MSPLHVISSGVDSVISDLRDLSVDLQQLKLVNITIAYDFYVLWVNKASLNQVPCT
jgi:hypothetical protein